MSTGTVIAVTGAAVFVSLVGLGLWLRPRLDRRLAGIDGSAGEARVMGTLREHASGAGLGSFIRPYRGPLVVTVLLALIDTLLALASPWPLKLIIDSAVGPRPLPQALPLIGGLQGLSVVNVAVALGVGLVVAAALVSYLVSVLVGTISLNIAADLRVAVFDRLLQLPVQVHDRHRSGDLVTRLTGDVSQVQTALVSRVQTALPGVATMVGMSALMLFLDPDLALLVLAVVPPLALLAVLRQRRVADVQRAARSRSGELAARAAEIMRHVRAVQTFGQQENESGRFRTTSGASAQAAGKALVTSARLAPVADLLLAVVLGAVLWTGSAEVIRGQITLGELLIFMSYLASVRIPIRSLSGLAATLGRGKASQERLLEVLSEPPLPQSPQPVSVPPGPAELRLEHVRFGYNADTPVLEDVSFTLPSGEMVCIVGKTGAGKSTLLSLLVRLHDPDSGAVRMGGIDLRDMALADVRGRLAFVPQDAWVMAGTIADNVRYGTTDADADQVRAACEAALVTEFTDRFPAGLDTPVGEGGLLLSGGQRRRVALARALLRGSPVLLLDEPTNGLDATSEALVIAAIRRAAVGRTVLIVTHQLSLAEVADHIVVLADGRVAESGPPDALRSQDGPYARLLNSQRQLQSVRAVAHRTPHGVRPHHAAGNPTQ